MVNDEILGGLKSAIERGESLKKAMMTFFNAGYKKEQIEEAAQFLNQNPTPVQGSQSYPVSSPEQKEKFFEKFFKKKTQEQKKNSPVLISIPQAPVQSVSQPTPQIVSNYGTPQQPKQIQQISNYEKEEPKDRILIAILITVLVLLVGILASIFLFKQEIINFFSNAIG